MSYKILLAEDEDALRDILKLYLTRDGYDVIAVRNGQEALEAIYETPFDAMILDWMMPEMGGIELVKEARRRGLMSKVLMITAKSTQEDEFLSLSSGFDDFLRKPFDPKILLLRLKKLLPSGDALISDSISLAIHTRLVIVQGEEIELTTKEYELLAFFMKNKGRILTREQLISGIWGLSFEGGDRTVDNLVKRLRKKIGESSIKTMRGMGYQFD